MRILFITQWYNPIKLGGAKRTTKMAHCISELGHKVTVLTGMPSYPTGILPKKYKWKIWMKEKEGNINVIRTYEYPTPNRGVFKRIINNLSFMFSSLTTLIFLPPHDAVIVSSPPFLSGITGLAAAWLFKAKFYFDVRDLWPDSAVQMGVLNQKFLTRVFEKIEKTYYAKTTGIFTATPHIQSHLVKEGISYKKTIVLITPIDTSFFKPQKINRKAYNFSADDFIVCYIGNHSRLYDLVTVLEAANLLKKYVKIKFLLIGEGEEKEKLLILKRKLNLDNVIFFEVQPYEKIRQLINMSNIPLIPLANIRVTQESFPLKAPEYLACGKPVVASISGDIKKYLLDYQAGLIYPSGDLKKFKENILKLYNHPKLVEKMSKNARELALDIFDDKNFIKTLTRIFGLVR